MRVSHQTLVELTKENSSFSRQMPGMQLAIDSTSLGTYKECPRKYLLSTVFGYRTHETATDLVFGLMVHGAHERYAHGRAQGLDHDKALRAAVMWVMRETWDSALGKPKWPQFPPVPEKTRLTCIRTCIWFLDHYGEHDNLETLILANGKPAVELSFQFLPGWETADGEEIMLCGHIDRVARHGDSLYGLDPKTTKLALDKMFFAKFAIDNQMALYDGAGQVILPEPIKGIMIDGIQVQVNGNRFHRHLLTRTPEQRDEWLAEAHQWTQRMEESARQGLWPANEKSCGLFRGCQFRETCARSPSQRNSVLERDFRREIWDPLRKRGDV